MGLSFTPTRLNDLVTDVLLTTVARGDILYRGASKWNNLAPGNAGDVLTSGGAGASPSWAAAAGGAPFDDATAIVKGSVDATKLLRFEVDGFTVGVTRVLTPPNANATIAGLEVAQTFTAQQAFETGATGTAGAIFRQTGGVAGTDELQISHSGSSVILKVMDNSSIVFQNSSGTTQCSIAALGTTGAFTCNDASGEFNFSANSRRFYTGGLDLITTDCVFWRASSFGTQDTAISRTSAGVVTIHDVGQTGNPGIAIQARSSTTNLRDRVWLTTVAVDNTDASRKYRGILSAYDTAARECIRFEADGSVGRVGIGGAVDSSSTLNVIGKQTIQTGADATIGLNVVGNSTSQSAALIRLLSNNSTSAGLASLEWLSGTTARALSIAMSGDDGALRLRQSGTEYATLNINPGSSIGVGFSGTSSGPGISFTANGTGAIIFGSTVSTGAYTVDFGKRASDGAICTAGVYTANYGSWASILNSALTNTVGTYQTFRHRTTGTPAAGFGAGLAFTLNSSTTADQDAALFSTEWVTATHASRAARGKLTAYDTAARECIRIEASGSAPMVGFLGASAVVQQTGDIAVALENLGLVTAGTSLGPKYLMAAATLMAG